MGATVYERIAAMQGADQNTPVWVCGEQLKDILRAEAARGNHGAEEIVEKDLDVAEMSVAQCEKKIKEYADKHKHGGFAFVAPKVAEGIIRKFYGLPDAAEAEQAKPKSGELDLASFF